MTIKESTERYTLEVCGFYKSWKKMLISHISDAVRRIYEFSFVSESNVAGYILQSPGQTRRRSVLRATILNSSGFESQQAIALGITRKNVPRFRRLPFVSRSKQHLTFECTYTVQCTWTRSQCIHVQEYFFLFV